MARYFLMIPAYQTGGRSLSAFPSREPGKDAPSRVGGGAGSVPTAESERPPGRAVREGDQVRRRARGVIDSQSTAPCCACEWLGLKSDAWGGRCAIGREHQGDREWTRLTPKRSTM